MSSVEGRSLCDDLVGACAAVSKLKTVDAQRFRDAMCQLGAAVHVVTTDGPAGKSGFTATAVCSVSDSPATILMCINRGASSMPVLRDNGVFCVNTLRAGEETIADIFAGRTKVSRGERFAAGEWLTLSTGSPVLRSAMVAFDSRISEVKSVASHDVYFGVVEAVHSGAPGAALIYHDRVYKQV